MAVFGIFWVFLQAAAAQVVYLGLRLEGGSFPRPLRPAEERAAFAALQAGDPSARDRLIHHNLRLVAHVVKKYYAADGSSEDLISIGSIGLIKAVDTFRPERGVRFASYAGQCIENEIRMHLRRVRREGTVLSLQEPLEGGEGDGGLTLGDVLPEDAAMEERCEQSDEARRLGRGRSRRCAARRLRALVAGLPPRQRELLTLRYGLDGRPPRTQNQVAARFGISRSYVSRLEKRALDQLARQWRQN